MRKYKYYYTIFYKNARVTGSMEIFIDATIEKTKIKHIAEYIQKENDLKDTVVITNYSFMFKLRR